MAWMAWIYLRTLLPLEHLAVLINTTTYACFDPQTFTGFSGDDDNSSDAGLTKEERKEKYRCQKR